jgi:flagellin-like protein
MRNKRGLSDVITTLIMVALVIVIITIIWIAIDRMVQDSTQGSEACFDIAGKASINTRYTCYDSTSKNLTFSLALGDISPDAVIVTVSTIGTTKSYEIKSDGTSTYAKVANYGGAFDAALTGLEANSGQTYISEDFLTIPDSIELYLKFGDKQCGISDATYEISAC